MSTYLYVTCLDHNPPLLAEEESGQHLYDLPRIRAEIAARETFADPERYYHGPTATDDFDPAEYFGARSARFLAAHPKCRIGITDEYGRTHPTEAET